ncbi:DNA (cytosine-5)-methyltransferase 3-like [Cynocephalus volans]|uniref:DNA (cytosine-5)-methyltransferase 3-like n=1 Tax=Cynocephalus volans TaxID=110931 RepID=UPI002FCC8C98
MEKVLRTSASRDHVVKQGSRSHLAPPPPVLEKNENRHIQMEGGTVTSACPLEAPMAMTSVGEERLPAAAAGGACLPHSLPQPCSPKCPLLPTPTECLPALAPPTSHAQPYAYSASSLRPPPLLDLGPSSQTVFSQFLGGAVPGSTALSSPGTLSLETLDGLDPDPAGRMDEEQRWLPCGTVLDLDSEHSMDVILVGPSKPSPPALPQLGRDLIAYEVKINQRSLEDICLCCGSFQVHTQHPLFEGGMCIPCKDKFLYTLFLYDEDGYQSYCSICCSGETLLICENPDCTRCYCFECVDTLVSPGTSEKVQAMSNWVCFLCLPFSRSGLLQRRKKWRGRLKAFYDRESKSPLEMYKTVPVWKREPMRVLSLFGDIKKELMSLGFLENGSDPGRLRHLEDVTDIVRRDVEEWGPFDLLYGSTPPLGHACDHPPGWYVFQFHRLLQYARPRQGSQQPFFWMFVDSLLLAEDDRAVASRFLETEPVTIQDVCGTDPQSAVHVWSNIPAVKSKHSAQASEEELSLLAQDRQRAKLPAQEPAKLVKNCFLPLREYFKYFSTELTSSL